MHSPLGFQSPLRRGPGRKSGTQEGQQVGIYRVRLGGRHAVREALVGLQRPVLQQLGRQWRGVDVGNDLIVVTVHHQDGHRDLLEVVGEVGLRERLDSVVVRLGAPIMDCRHQFWMTPGIGFTPGRLKP